MARAARSNLTKNIGVKTICVEMPVECHH